MRRFSRAGRISAKIPLWGGWLAWSALVSAGALAAGPSDPVEFPKVRVEAVLPFDFSRDALCFANKDPELARVGVPFLGAYGVETGVCQGMAGIAAAFLENVEFAPAAPRDSATTVRRRLREAVDTHQSRSGARIRIRGYASLREVCAAHRRAFLRKSIWLNAGIALDEIGAVYGQFRRLKGAPLSRGADTPALRRQLGETLATVLAELRAGRYPLLLVYSHVVLVRAYRELQAADGALRVELEVYDSNQPSLQIWRFPLDPQGVPTAVNRMHWVVSPQ